MKVYKAITLVLLLGSLTNAWAQETSDQRIPDDVFYLMPAFGHGMIYFKGQAPAQGELNICAVDHTLRFIDDSGTEMAAASHDNILRVSIDTVTFIRHQNAFLRLYPLSGDAGIAFRRDVLILRDAKQGAYGTTSQTSSINEYSTLYAEGGTFELNKSREYPYRVSETILVYKGDTVIIPGKNSLKRLFPDKKEEIDAYFKANRSFPDKLDEASTILSQWMQ